MDVVVTGSRGFLGRHLTAALQGRGDYVLGQDLEPDGLLYRDALDFFRADGHRYDLLIHCAAVTPHRAAIDGRALAVGAGNAELDAAMFRWAARTSPGRVVYISSSAAYPVAFQTGPPVGRLAEGDIRLDVPARPDAIYGWTKLTGERLAQAYRLHGGRVTVVRPFSGYGEDQGGNFPFGAFRDRALARQDPFAIWGDGSQVRDWVHVDDVVGAILAAVDRQVDGPVNVCTGVGTSMAELAGMFTREAGYEPRLLFQRDKPEGVAYRVGDPGHLHEFYTPKIDIEQGVRRALSPRKTSV